MEYERRMISLSRYYPELIRREDDKCEKFKSGLKQEIRSRISILGMLPYAVLVDRAMIAESDIKIERENRAAYHETRKRRRDEASEGGHERSDSRPYSPP